MKKIYLISNAVDETIRTERQIVTDSPAATRKVFMLAETLSLSGSQVVVISLGRGKAQGGLRFFGFNRTDFGQFSVLYLPFASTPFLSEIITFCSLPFVVMFYAFKDLFRNKVIVFYNRHPAYFLGLIVSSVLGFRRFVDIEDGEIKKGGFVGKFQNGLAYSFDKLCKHGSLLACSGLSSYTSIKNRMCYYGVVDSSADSIGRLEKNKIHVLFSGTINDETGIDILVEAINYMKSSGEYWCNDFVFEFSGQGEGVSSIEKLSLDERLPAVINNGRVSKEDYATLLGRCDIGLALKPIGGSLANTTFPSKIVEFSSHGLLVVSTDISDVKKVLGEEGALYLKRNSCSDLFEVFKYVILNLSEARSMARNGSIRLHNNLDRKTVGKELIDFFFNTEVS